jgi:hypothetical protein
LVLLIEDDRRSERQHALGLLHDLHYRAFATVSITRSTGPTRTDKAPVFALAPQVRWLEGDALSDLGEGFAKEARRNNLNTFVSESTLQTWTR